jgi:hypothetical protein
MPTPASSPTKSLGNVSFKDAKEQKKFELKLLEIDEKIKAVRAEMNSLSPESKKKAVKLPEIKEKNKKKQFYHPNLDFVMAEMAYSPYLCAPDEKYTSKTFLSAKVGELRFEKKTEAEKKIPYDLSVAKRRFMTEIVSFNPSFTIPKRVKVKPVKIGSRKHSKSSESLQSKESESNYKVPNSATFLTVEANEDEYLDEFEPGNSSSSVSSGNRRVEDLEASGVGIEEDEVLSAFASSNLLLELPTSSSSSHAGRNDKSDVKFSSEENAYVENGNPFEDALNSILPALSVDIESGSIVPEMYEGSLLQVNTYSGVDEDFSDLTKETIGPEVFVKIPGLESDLNAEADD